MMLIFLLYLCRRFDKFPVFSLSGSHTLHRSISK